MTIVRPAISADLPFIEDLRRKESENLGFVPKDVYRSVVDMVVVHPGRLRWQYQAIYVATDNNDLTGFCYCSFLGAWSHIFQLAVREDARRLERGLLLAGVVEKESLELSKRGVSCRVATDIEANGFWCAAGYLPVAEIRGGLARGRVLRQYHKYLTGFEFPSEHGSETVSSGVNESASTTETV